MSLTINNRAGSLYSDQRGQQDVTVKLTDENGVARYCNGFITEVGLPVYGCSLDPDAEFELEYARPEIKLTLLGYSGSVYAIEAWRNTVDGPRTVFKQRYQETVVILPSDKLDIVGPAY